MTNGHQLRDEGADRNLGPREHELFVEAVKDTIDNLISLGRSFTADDVWSFIPAGIGPSHPNVLPSIFNQYRRAGKIETVGYVPSKRKIRHAGVIRVWRPVKGKQ